MNPFTRNELRELLADRPGPCLSIYMPARPGETEHTPARWRSCLSAAETALVEGGARPREATEFLAPARALLDDGTIARQEGHGMAFFLAPSFQRLHRLPVAVEQRAVVGERFLVTPLLPLLGNDGPFVVLALSQKNVRLLRCTREEVAPVELPGVPANIEEALAAHDVDEPLNFHTRPLGAGRWAGIFHGQGVGIDDAKDDLLLYFRKIDRGLRPMLTREGNPPLVLAAVGHLRPIFREASGYASLVAEGLDGSPDRLSDQELQRRAWPLVAPQFRRDLEKSLAVYAQLNGTGRTACGVEPLVGAAARGELQTLFVAEGRTAWGRLDPASGEPTCHEQPAPRDEDLLNLAAVHVLRHGGTVHSLPVSEMPDGAPLAGIFWLPRVKHSPGREKGAAVPT